MATVKSIKSALKSHRVQPIRNGRKEDLAAQLDAVTCAYSSAIGPAPLPLEQPVTSAAVEPTVGLGVLLVQLVILSILWVYQVATERSEFAQWVVSQSVDLAVNVHRAGAVCGRWVFSLENVQLIPLIQLR